MATADRQDTADISNNDHPGPSTRRQRVVARARRRLRAARISPLMTRLLGPHYRPSVDLIAIDLTWACNLSCNNCSRSLGPAPTGDRMTVGQVRAFIEESERSGRRWRRVRLIGGEPTLHPDFLEIVALLRAWSARSPRRVLIQVATNGHGTKVESVLAQVRGQVEIINSFKDGADVRTGFDAFNEAPLDDPRFRGVDYANACPITEVCGMGLNRHGYYGCAVAGAIDRVVGLGLALPSLPAVGHDMSEQLRGLCGWCGHFKTGMRTPRATREPIYTQRNSPSWERAFARWREQAPRLPLYAEAAEPEAR